MALSVATMKRVNRLLLYVAAVVAAVSCTNEAQEIVYPEPDCANVELSSKSAIVAYEGGVKEIFVSTNRKSWSVECAEEWVDISIEGNSLKLFVDENSGAEGRMAVVEVVAGADPDTAVARYKLLQVGDATVNLSATECANSYVANTSSSYMIRADIKGNGKNNDNSRYVTTHGVDIEGGAYADVVWEATFDGDKTRSCAIIEGVPFYAAEDGYICFETGAIEGNALVALCSGDGEILWSWHIWVTDSPIEHSSANGLEWMDRNLGALSNDSGDIANRGMLYQWGRKDPFLPSPAPYVAMPKHSYDEEYNLTESEEEYYNIEAELIEKRQIVNVYNTQRGDGFGEWRNAGFEAPVALNAPGNIPYSVQHPTTYLACRTDIPIGEYVFDWYMQQDLMNTSGVLMQSESQLWGDAEQGTEYKTMFDPCPPGYCVPPRGAFGYIPSEYACTFVSDEWSAEEHGWRWSGGNGDYFPATGNFDVSGLIGETSEKMLYWTAESFGAGALGFGKAATLFVAFNDVYYGIYPLLDPSVAGAWYSYGARASAAAVRCVREQNK